MKKRIFKSGGAEINTFVMEGLTMTAGTITLSGDPTNVYGAVTKTYADATLIATNASLITSGTLAIGRIAGSFGVIGGDMVIDGFTGQTLLLSTNGNVDAFPENTVAIWFDVNEKGIVTLENWNEVASIFPGSRLPSLDWSKISPASRPTTVAGYGITNAITTGNTTISANLKMAQHAASAKEGCTKWHPDWYKTYVEGFRIATGTIVFKPTATTPSGYLRCNGSAVLISSYPALYAVIGLQGGASPPANYFYLPNMTSAEANQYYYYIKT